MSAVPACPATTHARSHAKASAWRGGFEVPIGSAASGPRNPQHRGILSIRRVGTIESSYDSRGKREIESDALVSLPNHTPPGDLRGRDHGAGVGSSRNIEAVSLVPALRERPYRLRERRGGLDRCSIHLTRSGRTHDRRDRRQRLLWIQPWGRRARRGCPGRGPAAVTRGRSAQKVP